MTTLSEMTKKELLDLAKEHEIVGRHEMTKEALVVALTEELGEDEDQDEGEDNADLGNEPEGEFINAEQLIEIKRRHKSAHQRDENGKVIRHGRNLSGNLPYAKKFYFLADGFMNLTKTSADYQAAFAAAPMQVQLLLKAMRELDIGEDNAMTGGEIAGLAINQGYVKTKIDPANLFAYYRKVLEALGVRLAEDIEE